MTGSTFLRVLFFMLQRSRISGRSSFVLEDQNEADGQNVSWGEAYKRLLTFLPVEKTCDTVCLDQIHEAMEQKMMKKA